MKTTLSFALYCLISSLFDVSLTAQQNRVDFNRPVLQNLALKQSAAALPPDAARLRKRVQERQNELAGRLIIKQKKWTALNAQNAGLPTKGVVAIEGEIKDIKNRISRLDHVLVNIDRLWSDPVERYRLIAPNSTDGEAHEYKSPTEEINIEGSCDALYIHEIEHVIYSLDHGGGLFAANGYLINRGKMTEEVLAYKSQYAMDPSALKDAPNSMAALTHIYVTELTYPNGKPVHPEYNEAYQAYRKALKNATSRPELIAQIIPSDPVLIASLRDTASKNALTRYLQKIAEQVAYNNAWLYAFSPV